MKHVKRFRVRGRWYYYHRPTGTRLPDDPHSAEFVRRLAELDALMVAGFVTVLAPMLAGTVCLLFRRKPMAGVMLLFTGLAWSIYLGFLYWRFMT